MTKVAPVSVARLRASPGYAWHLLASSAPPREASPLPRVLELATSHTASDFPGLYPPGTTTTPASSPWVSRRPSRSATLSGSSPTSREKRRDARGFPLRLGCGPGIHKSVYSVFASRVCSPLFLYIPVHGCFDPRCAVRVPAPPRAMHGLSLRARPPGAPAPCARPRRGAGGVCCVCVREEAIRRFIKRYLSPQTHDSTTNQAPF